MQFYLLTYIEGNFLKAFYLNPLYTRTCRYKPHLLSIVVAAEVSANLSPGCNTQYLATSSDGMDPSSRRESLAAAATPTDTPPVSRSPSLLVRIVTMMMMM